MAFRAGILRWVWRAGVARHPCYLWCLLASDLRRSLLHVLPRRGQPQDGVGGDGTRHHHGISLVWPPHAALWMAVHVYAAIDSSEIYADAHGPTLDHSPAILPLDQPARILAIRSDCAWRVYAFGTGGRRMGNHCGATVHARRIGKTTGGGHCYGGRAVCKPIRLPAGFGFPLLSLSPANQHQQQLRNGGSFFSPPPRGKTGG